MRAPTPASFTALETRGAKSVVVGCPLLSNWLSLSIHFDFLPALHFCHVFITQPCILSGRPAVVYVCNKKMEFSHAEITVAERPLPHDDEKRVRWRKLMPCLTHFLQFTFPVAHARSLNSSTSYPGTKSLFSSGRALKIAPRAAEKCPLNSLLCFLCSEPRGKLPAKFSVGMKMRGRRLSSYARAKLLHAAWKPTDCESERRFLLSSEKFAWALGRARQEISNVKIRRRRAECLRIWWMCLILI